jgi:hypothetical protein
MMGGQNVAATTESTEIRTAQPNHFPAPDLQPIPANISHSTQTAVAEFPTVSPRQPRTNNLPPSASTSTVESTYKPGLLDWFWDLPIFVKAGVGVLIFSLIFAFALKMFMKFDVSVVSNDPAATATEPQTPWFSSWFRSTPTAEEIFDKYEKETFAKGKKVSAQSYSLTGTILFPKSYGSGDLDMSNLYQTKTFSLTAAELAYQTKFSLFVKAPNKMFFKRETFYNNAPNYSLTIGYDGMKNWAFSSRYYNNKATTEDEKLNTTSFYSNATPDGVSLIFQQSAFPKIESGNQEVVFNRKSYNLKATNFTGEETNLFFDVETGLLTKIVRKDLTMFVIDHKDFNGVLHPAKLVCRINNVWYLLNVEKIEPDVPINDTIFLRSSY